MEIRPVTSSDLDNLREIDGTVESTHYLHLDQQGEGFGLSWKLDKRELREKRIDSNAMDEDVQFILKQIASGADEGLALIAEHENQAIGLLVAQPSFPNRTLRLLDLRVDYDFRRQGIGMAMIYQAIARAREMELRAVQAETRTNNHPAGELLLKCAFELAGVDTRRLSNHDIVKEAATLIWYASLD